MTCMPWRTRSGIWAGAARLATGGGESDDQSQFRISLLFSVPHQQFLIDGAGDVGQHASPNHFCASWLMELRRSWIVGLIEALEKVIRRDSSRLQASPFQTGRIS